MASELELTVKEAYEIADNFALASARLLEYRIESRSSISKEDAEELERCEDSLDHMVVIFRGYGIKLIGAGAQKAVAELKSAIDAGKSAIDKINKIKKVIKVAGALVDLAVAVLAKDPKSILMSAKKVIETSKVKKA